MLKKNKDKIFFEKLTRMLVFLFILFLLLISGCKKDDISNEIKLIKPVIAYSKVDKVKAQIGDIINYTLTIESEKDVKLNIPNLQKKFSDFYILEKKENPSKIIDNKNVKIFNFKIQAQKVGSYIIEPIEIQYVLSQNLENKYGKTTNTKTSKIFIEIQSVLQKTDKNNDIEDIKPLEKILVLNLAFIIIGSVILVLLILLFIFRKRFKKVKAPKKFLAHEIAFEELEYLKESQFIENNELKIFYFQLSDILRRYLKNRFDIVALEKISNELIKEIETNYNIEKENKEFLIYFLETTDFYKYTDFISTSELANELFEKAYLFIENTKDILESKEEKI